MEFLYDRDADALSVELLPEARSQRTVQLGPGIAADLDAAGRLIAVEVLDASYHYPLEVLESLDTPEEWLTLAAAARESGLEGGTLRQLVHAGKFPSARKRGRDWEITEVDLANYLANRAPAGRPAKRRKGRRERVGACR